MLGKRLDHERPLPVDDPNAVLSGFANPKMGEWIDQTLEADSAEKGALDATAPYRDDTPMQRIWHLSEANDCIL